MSPPKLVKLERIPLKNHAHLTERWVQEQIALDPSILGLGDVVLKDKERMQPHAGRLDLLLQEAESNRRYEVELQLGRTDESHIIRTIEYWDIERRRFPQYDHCAVIIAEEITARFLNVVSLFNGQIPIIALQMAAYAVGDGYALCFVRVLDETTLGLVDEDEETQETTDRAYWEVKGSKASVQIADDLLGLIHNFAPGYELKYNKHYIGLTSNGQPDNFVVFRAKKEHLNLEARLPKTKETDQQIEAAGLDTLEYEARWRRYRIRLTPVDVKRSEVQLSALMKQAFDER